MSKENKACSARQKLRSKTKNDLIFLFAILLVLCIAGGVLLLGRTAGDTVIVTVDGELWGEYSLYDDQTVPITKGEGHNLLIIENGEAYVSSASCPDGICSSHRPIKNNGESIICLPNKVVIEIRSQSKNQPDIIT